MKDRLATRIRVDAANLFNRKFIPSPQGIRIKEVELDGKHWATSTRLKFVPRSVLQNQTRQQCSVKGV
jgi:hypothetical protein